MVLKTRIRNLFFFVTSNPHLLYFYILVLGIFARIWEFNKIPPGLNQDEASIGLEAYSLFHFGVDRMGISFPVNFISWGNGMDALYGYILIPFMPLGLTPAVIRLPILITGILSLPLLYTIVNKSFGKSPALISMFLLAISPWHIMMSRWGINENILPFVFLLGYMFLTKSQVDNNWFIAASVLFALCLYAYAAAYVAIPVFLFLVILVLIKSGRLSIRTLIIGLSIFALLAMPLVLFVFINSRGMDSIHLGLFTIPKLPVKPRMLTVVASDGVNPLQTVIFNLFTMIGLLLINRSDGLSWNSLDPYGYLYSYSLPFAVTGFFLLLIKEKSKFIPENLYVVSWLFASLCIGLAQSVNINRIHLVFIPIIICTAICLDWIGRRRKFVLAMLICAYVINFAAFTYDYHGDRYRKVVDESFYSGLLPALEYANQFGGGSICVTDHVKMPYIYALFSDPMNPSEYLNDIKYIDQKEQFQRVRSFGRYTFGIEYCPKATNMVYILLDEVPENTTDYAIKEFDIFRVYLPK
jgi:hypothetical protein